MIYERVDYMCPECSQIHFFKKGEKFSIICPECNIEMVYIGNKFTSKEEEEEKKARRSFQKSVPIVYCPYCNSFDTDKISGTSKIINTAIFGIFGTKRHKQWHCNQCGSDF